MYFNRSEDDEDHILSLLSNIRESSTYSSFIHNDTIESINNCYDQIVLSSKEHGSEHPTTLQFLYQLSDLLISIRHYDNATKILERSTLGCKRCYGEVHVEVAHFLTLLANSLNLNLKYAESIVLYKQALCIYEVWYGRSHVSIAALLENISHALYSMQSYEDSQLFYERLLVYYRVNKGNAHLDTLKTINKLASAYQCQGKYIEADVLCSDSLADCVSTLGSNHPTTQKSVVTLAQVKQAQGKLKEAELMYRKSLESNEQLLGMTHEETLANVVILARLLYEQREMVPSEHMYRRALRGYMDSIGTGDSRTTDVMHCIGEILLQRELIKDALTMLRDAYDARKMFYGQHHPLALSTQFLIGKTLLKASLWRHRPTSPQKGKSAIMSLQETLHGFDKVLGAEHAKTMEVVDCLGDVLLQRDEFVQAGNYFQRYYDYLMKHKGAMHRSTSEVAYKLAVITERSIGKIVTTLNDSQLFIKASGLYKQAYDGYKQAKADFKITDDDDVERKREELLELDELIDDAEEMCRYALMRSKY